MEETQLQHAAVVVRQLGKNPLHGIRPFLLGRRLGDCERQVFVELGLGQSEPGAPEAAEHRAGGGEEITANGARRRALPEPWNRFQGNLLGEVFGIGTVANAGVDERIYDLELTEGDVSGARRHRELEQIPRLVWCGLPVTGRWARAHRRPSSGRKRLPNSIPTWIHTALGTTGAGYWNAPRLQPFGSRRGPGDLPPARRSSTTRFEEAIGCGGATAGNRVLRGA